VKSLVPNLKSLLLHSKYLLLKNSKEPVVKLKDDVNPESKDKTKDVVNKGGCPEIIDESGPEKFENLPIITYIL
jgi:hypothetical protein